MGVREKERESGYECLRIFPRNSIALVRVEMGGIYTRKSTWVGRNLAQEKDFRPEVGGFPPRRRISAQIWAGFRPLGGFSPILGGFPPLGRVSA